MSQISKGEAGQGSPESSPSNKKKGVLSKFRKYFRFLNRPRKKKPKSRKDPTGDRVNGDALASVKQEHHILRFGEEDKQKHFGKTTGLHSSYDQTKRVEIQLEVIEHLLQVETVTDLETGKSLRADTLSYGPPQSQMTWKALNFFIQMSAGFSTPYCRVSDILGVISAPQIYGSLFNVVRDVLLPVYLQMIDDLADANQFQIDDSPTLVLDLRKKVESGIYEVSDNEILKKLEEELGFFNQLKSKKGSKSKVNISSILASSDLGPIAFFRTHVGSCGDLLSKILELRSPSKGPFLIQGDGSSENHLAPNLAHLPYKHFGCGSHARRPFWRHKDDDIELCDFFLHGFGIIAKIEDWLKEVKADQPTILRYRQRYEKKVWEALHRKASSVCTNKTSNSKLGHHIWPLASHFGKACKYILKNCKELTAYLDYAQIEWTNNTSERNLRGEKLLLNASKFRRTEMGRVVLDILRSILMTCQRNKVPLDEYLEFLYRNRDLLKSKPQKMTPYAYARHRKKTEGKSEEEGSPAYSASG